MQEKTTIFIFPYILSFQFALRYYANFKEKKFESLFYKIDICLQKTTTCIGLQVEPIFSVNIE